MYTGNPHQDRKGPLYGGGRWMNPNFPNEPKPFKQNPPEMFWNDGTPLNDPNMLQPLTMNGPLNPSGIQLAELTQKQMDYMGGWKNTPAFGGISKEGLWNNVKDMEYIKPAWKFWGEPSQESTTRQEFNDYYNQLLQGKTGNWVT